MAEPIRPAVNGPPGGNTLLSATGPEGSSALADHSRQAPKPLKAPEATLAPEATAVQRSSRFPLVTTRVGLLFVVIASGVLGCAIFAQAAPVDSKLNSMMWIIASATCSLGGLVAMKSVRNLRILEKELRRAKPGERQWQVARPILSSDPISLGWNQLLEDVNQRQRSEQKPRVAAALDQEVVTLARAMRGMPVAWVITDTEGIIRYLGPAASGLLNLDEDQDYAGQDFPEMIGLRDDSDSTADALLQRFLGPIRMVHERRSIEVGSRALHVRVTRSRLPGRSGDGEGLAWVLTDVTQQRIATEARDQFLMTATHELRTPLSNLQAYAEALQDEEDLEIERQKEFCNVINSEANRLGRLVDQLLTVSQMEAGSMVPNRHELELLPMLEHVSDQLKGQAEQKQIVLTNNLSVKLPTVFGDRDKLQAAIVNLVGNAIKYTPECGQVAIRCSADDRWIRIDVEDDGPGIPEDELEKVFEKFFRGASTHDSDQRGNGLGLAFAREIARLHGGEIELQSIVGEGSVFTMRMPVGGRSRSGL
ncbi:MAG: ATP-binding protein [Rubripirellula sp.]|nr:ATP-binding protein [Rubripirellula sp.]